MSARTIVRKTDQLNPSREDIRLAASIIRSGGTVVFPTETVYGIGANAYDEKACSQIFRIKKRPPDNPLIVHVKDVEMASSLARMDSRTVEALKRSWPSPLTVVVNSLGNLPNVVTAGLDTVALRSPANPLALALISESGVPIAAPSANIATRPSIVLSSEAKEELMGRVDFIFDSGQTFFGIESTIIDVRGDVPVILRPGAIGPVEIRHIFGSVRFNHEPPVHEEQIPLAPGMKYRHYAPRKPLYLFEDPYAMITYCRNRRKDDFISLVSAEMAPMVPGEKIILGSEKNLYEIGRNLFHSLRVADRTEKEIILAHAVEERGIGLAIMNRLRKAAEGGTPPD